jgi:PAS domain S-box-containing protein
VRGRPGPDDVPVPCSLADPPRLRELLALLEHLPVAVYLVDRHERWRYLNTETGAILGRDPSELVGRTLAETFPEEVRQTLAEHNRRVVASGEVLRLEEVVTDVRTGRPHDFLTLKLPLLDEDGTVSGIGGVSVDVTRQDSDRRSKSSRTTSSDRRSPAPRTPCWSPGPTVAAAARSSSATPCWSARWAVRTSRRPGTCAASWSPPTRPTSSAS